MARNLLQDMVKVKNSRLGSLKEENRFVKREKREQNLKDEGKTSKYRLFLVAIISIVFLLFALSFLFSGAKITLVSKVRDMPIKENLSATKDSNASGGLSFDLVLISGEENKIMQGSEQKNIAVASKGIVVIYNSFSTSSQALDIDTRLEGSNGKIYKTNKKITVPGIKDGKPGSVEVGIYGAIPGEAHNSSPIDFKIFGFKGTPKYSKFYGRSKGEITGGFEGKSSVVSSLDKATAVSELKANLESNLLKKVSEQIPSGFILFKDAVFLNINDKDTAFIPDKENTVVATVKGTLYGFLFNEEKLTERIAQNIIEKYDGSKISIPNIRDLTFTLSDKESSLFSDIKKINFTLTGTPRIVWKIDETKFVADLLNKKKKDFNQILSQYSNIESAELVMRPFWKTNFPENSKSIKVIVK